MDCTAFLVFWPLRTLLHYISHARIESWYLNQHYCNNSSYMYSNSQCHSPCLNTVHSFYTHHIFVLSFFPCLLSSQCEYVEEFPIQALPQFSSLSGHEISNHGLIVVVLQYGKKKNVDYLGRNRAHSDWSKANESNFLHPVLYYYDKLPTGE